MSYEEVKEILSRYAHFTCEVQREQVIKAMLAACERQEQKTIESLRRVDKPYWETETIS